MTRQRLNTFAMGQDMRGNGRRGERVRRAVLLAALGLAAVTLAMLGGRPTPADAQTSNIAGYLYGAPNYGGGERPLYKGSVVTFNGTTWDNAATSIRVSPGMMISLYRDPELTGICETFTADDPNLGNNRIGDNQVTSIHVGAPCNAPVARLYEHLNFTGASVVIAGLTGGWETTDLRRVGFDDTTTSIRVPAGEVVAVWEHPGPSGRCETFRADDGDLRNNYIGDNTISAVKFGAACPMVVYEDANHTGGRLSVQFDVPDLRVPAYNMNDTISSIKVPAGMVIAVYRDINYTGICETFTADDLDLRDNRIGNDTISSWRFGRGC